LHFVEGHRDQKLPQIATTLEVVATLAGLCEEDAVDRLHHILRIELLPHLRRQPAARQRDQPAGITLKQLRGGLLIAGAPAGHQIVRVVISHRRGFPAMMDSRTAALFYYGSRAAGSV